MTAWSVGAPGSLLWFAQHDLRLAWRDWLAVMAAGRSVRGLVASGVVCAGIFGLHLLANATVGPALEAGVQADLQTLVVVSAAIAMSLSLMLSQALESATRVLYTRSDLDLILSSPASHARLFAVRVAAITLSTAALSGAIVAPFINVAIWIDGWHWLAAYGVVLCFAAIATALAVSVTFALFYVIGPRRTRLVAQVVAAVVGAAFLVGTQVAAIMWYGEVSRIDLFRAADLLAVLPGAESALYVPARAAMGETTALTILGLLAAGLLASAIVWSSRRLAAATHVTAGATATGDGLIGRIRPLPVASPAQALRAKEFRLLARDPWLVSQTLMQLLYLVPPAVLLWQSFGNGTSGAVLLAPIVVMAVGQLAGGLAWLAISGEDGADLIATAPLSERTVITAKVQAVLAIVIVVCAPFCLAISLSSVWAGGVTLISSLIAALAAIAIQLLFRVQARRAQFRRRQTASRLSTFTEAFSSILWAATAGLAASGAWAAGVTAVLAAGVLGVAWLLRPPRTQHGSP
ncbi:MAG: permease [Pseudomonadota bacterium]